jgi:Zn finger protein HypA/HybF involved in hydrogenase expression
VPSAPGVARSLLQSCSVSVEPALPNCQTCRTTRTATGVVRLCSKCSGKQFKLVGGACGEWVVGRW